MATFHRNFQVLPVTPSLRMHPYYYGNCYLCMVYGNLFFGKELTGKGLKGRTLNANEFSCRKSVGDCGAAKRNG